MITYPTHCQECQHIIAAMKDKCPECDSTYVRGDESIVFFCDRCWSVQALDAQSCTNCQKDLSLTVSDHEFYSVLEELENDESDDVNNDPIITLLQRFRNKLLSYQQTVAICMKFNELQFPGLNLSFILRYLYTNQDPQVKNILSEAFWYLTRITRKAQPCDMLDLYVQFGKDLLVKEEEAIIFDILTNHDLNEDSVEDENHPKKDEMEFILIYMIDQLMSKVFKSGANDEIKNEFLSGSFQLLMKVFGVYLPNATQNNKIGERLKQDYEFELSWIPYLKYFDLPDEELDVAIVFTLNLVDIDELNIVEKIEILQTMIPKVEFPPLVVRLILVYYEAGQHDQGQKLLKMITPFYEHLLWPDKEPIAEVVEFEIKSGRLTIEKYIEDFVFVYLDYCNMQNEYGETIRAGLYLLNRFEDPYIVVPRLARAYLLVNMPEDTVALIEDYYPNVADTDMFLLVPYITSVLIVRDIFQAQELFESTINSSPNYSEKQKEELQNLLQILGTNEAMPMTCEQCLGPIESTNRTCRNCNWSPYPSYIAEKRHTLNEN